VRNDGTARPVAVFCRRRRRRDVSTPVSRRTCTCLGQSDMTEGGVLSGQPLFWKKRSLVRVADSG
jgi:hypothetical protein